MDSVPLASLDVGMRCEVLSVDCEDPALRVRLMELGLLPHTRVLVERKAPLGCPIELHLRGYALSIRKQDAMAIQVVIEGAGGAAS